MKKIWTDISGFFIVVILLLIPTVIIAQENVIDIQLKRLKQYPDDKEALREICFLYLNKADYDNAIVYGNQLFDIGYKEQDYNRAVLYSHICLGQAHMMKGNADKAYSHLGQAQAIGESNKNDSALCSVYNGLGLYASNVQKDYYLSLTYFFKGIESAKRCQYDRLYSLLLCNIAGIYYLKNDSTGLKYALECYELGHERKDAFLIYIGSANAAYMYYLKGEYQTALKYIQETEFVMIQSDFYDQSNVYNLYGYIVSKLKNDDEAISYFRKSLEMKEHGHTSSIINAYLGYSDILMKRKQYEQAILMLNEGVALSDNQTSAIYRGNLLKSLARCYEDLGNPTEALKYYKRYQIENDSLYNAEKERAVSEIRAKYDVERQENENKQNKLKLLERENKMQLLVAGLVCVIFAASLLYYLYSLVSTKNVDD
ncbi:tetratricopeptide repeat protein [Bacteroides ovatus]|uniref:Tetratricopeptide repeat-containing protein n=1 Tax=Bacteroides ovatus TaxID=28116 RepID=A0A1G8GXY7_BACOV|nr:tetratricopeptide repeat protein [Bacteroides ovatus]SDH99227.1 Tetratricopeptide repeat-containing protein [Bacteroides ovatus]